MRVRYDLHTHSTYSDGWDLDEMVETAAEIGLDAIGFADHCPIGTDAFGRRERYDLADTYEIRREDISTAAERHGVQVLDAAEVNYDPAKEPRIATFLEEAGFTYTIGSVHFVEKFDIAQPDLRQASRGERQRAVDRYVDWVVALIESELFDIVGHIDLVQRDPALRGLMDEMDYRRIADALVYSRTIPEINAGRIDRSYGTIHPHPDRLALFSNRDIPFVIGSDAHAPDQLTRRLDLLSDVLDTIPVTIKSRPPGMR